ncbi:hypothetical protein DICVIV_11775 [Dictyocaulus viviparus]|uniref:Uncharacterized protein n=1 Tax=Dictyocaulus viviparus TaxID=29172 RepID=A0A0D8XEY6_DICVI|nr:hypothetical protein DICVIV_11775 [Dictyocaulus viviparus]
MVMTLFLNRTRRKALEKSTRMFSFPNGTTKTNDFRYRDSVVYNISGTRRNSIRKENDKAKRKYRLVNMEDVEIGSVGDPYDNKADSDYPERKRRYMKQTPEHHNKGAQAVHKRNAHEIEDTMESRISSDEEQQVNSVAVRVKRVSRAGSSHRLRVTNKNKGNSHAGQAEIVVEVH